MNISVRLVFRNMMSQKRVIRANSLMLKYIAWHLAEKDEAVKLSHRAAGTTVWSKDNSFTVGLNWQIFQGVGRRTIVTDGNLPGHHCMCVLRPESKVGIIALTNEEVRSKPANLSAPLIQF